MLGRSGITRYVLLWLLGGGAVAGLALVLVAGDDDERGALPPVAQINLADAARQAGCELRDASRSFRLNPAVVGPVTARPVPPAVYDRPQDDERLVAALAEGRVVFHYRLGLDERSVDRLVELHAIVPRGTIVVPNATGMTYDVAATAWDRLLGCRRFTDEVIDALRLFRGRFLGIGRAGM